MMKPILPQVGKVYQCGLVPGVRVLVTRATPDYFCAEFMDSMYSFEVDVEFLPEEGEAALDTNDEEESSEFNKLSSTEWALLGFTLAEPDHCKHVESLSGNTLTLTDTTRQHLEAVAAALDFTPQQVMERLIDEYLKTGRWLCTPEPEAPDFDSPEDAAKLEAWLDEGAAEEIPFWPVTNSGKPKS